MKRILILENDWLNLSSLNNYLKKKGHLVNCSQSIKRAESLLKKSKFDLFLCERFLPDGDVLDLLEKIKEKKLFMRILVFSHKKSLFDRIDILKLANDFLAKPFNLIELSLKVDNLLKLEKIEDNNFIENSLFLLKDSDNLENKNHLRPQELKILECLLKHKNMVLPYETISSYVWGYREPQPLKKTISVYIRRIRTKLFLKNLKIITVKNRGYKLINLEERNI
jgi:DNA-binding response OmpR family regulator